MVSTELLKGSLKSIVLKLLAENGRMYGYDITRKVEELTAGKIKLTYGALYPVLHKLELDGVVKTESENYNNRTRIYYELTPKGNNFAAEKIKELQEYIEVIGMVLNPKIQMGYVRVKH
jgi:PadR family transcriptional regulator, regulatory protein PadR